MQLHPQVVASIHWRALVLETAPLVMPTSSPTALHWWLHLSPLNANISRRAPQDFALVHRELCSSSPMLVEPTPFVAINLAFKPTTLDNDLFPNAFFDRTNHWSLEKMMASHHFPCLLPSETQSRVALQWPHRHDIYQSTHELEPSFVAIKAIKSHLCVCGCKKSNKASFVTRLCP